MVGFSDLVLGRRPGPGFGTVLGPGRAGLCAKRSPPLRIRLIASAHKHNPLLKSVLGKGVARGPRAQQWVEPVAARQGGTARISVFLGCIRAPSL